MVVIAIAAMAVIAVTTIIILFINFSLSLGSLLYCTGPPEARDVLPGCFEDLYKSITSIAYPGTAPLQPAFSTAFITALSSSLALQVIFRVSDCGFML